MTTDREIRRKYVAGQSVQSIAKELGHDANSVRGRVHRASLQDRIGVAQDLATARPLQNTGLLRQEAVIRRGEQAFAEKQYILQLRGTEATAVFCSDIHLPYTNWAAFYLYLLILQHINPDYVSAYNDFNDFEGYGRWADVRNPASQLWTSDIENGLRLDEEVLHMVRKAAPNARLLQVMGNHDLWMFNYMREKAISGFTEHSIADFMERMENAGVAQFSNGITKQENVVQLSPGLKWTHGVSASANPAAVARATSEKLKGRGEESGIYYDTRSGHTHRAAMTPVNGRMHINSGSFMQDDPKYLKHRPFWDIAFCVDRYDPNGRWVDGELVEIKERKGRYVARFDGIDFDVPLVLD